MSYRVVDRATGETVCTVIDMQEGRYWRECPMCEKGKRLDHAVAWYCGPTHDEIGSVSTEYSGGGIVGGMSVCKDCHDKHYRMGRWKKGSRSRR